MEGRGNKEGRKEKQKRKRKKEGREEEKILFGMIACDITWIDLMVLGFPKECSHL